jgi:alanyl-tRNA synthetase
MTRQIHRLEEILTQFSEGDIDDSDDRQFLTALLKEEWLAARDHLRRLLETREPEQIKKLISEFRQWFIIPGKFIFNLYTVHGLPPEMIKEIIKEVLRPAAPYAVEPLALNLDLTGFQEEFKKHQELSRAGAEKKFHGGLADHQYNTVRLHTATHLLHATLRKVLGEQAEQRGSNITAERLRFDFTHPTKLTPEQIKQVEEMINEVIKQDLPMSFEVMNVDEARAKGAIGLFEGRYEDKVKVYTVGDPRGQWYSREICGGPHVEHTGELKNFKITKEEPCSAGVRRIKAVVDLSLPDV